MFPGALSKLNSSVVCNWSWCDVLLFMKGCGSQCLSFQTHKVKAHTHTPLPPADYCTTYWLLNHSVRHTSPGDDTNICVGYRTFWRSTHKCRQKGASTHTQAKLQNRDNFHDTRNVPKIRVDWNNSVRLSQHPVKVGKGKKHLLHLSSTLEEARSHHKQMQDVNLLKT